jgi:hypothetical protein
MTSCASQAAERSATVTSDDVLVNAMANGNAPSATIPDTSNGDGATKSDEAVVSANVASSVMQGPDAPKDETEAKKKMEAKAAQLADEELERSVSLQFGWRTGVVILAVWILLFIGAVLLRQYADARAWQVLGVFFYVGTIVFGGTCAVIHKVYH